MKPAEVRGQKDQYPELFETLQSHPSQNDNISTILSHFGLIGMSVTADALPKVLPPDVMEPVPDIMAEVRAYFQGLSLLLLA